MTAALLAGTVGVAASAAPATHPATRPATRIAATRPAMSAATAKSIDALLLQGQDALAAGDFKSARDAFRDILSVDPNDLSATEGAALAYLQLGDYGRAKAEAEHALASPAPMRRSTAINVAFVFERAKLPMRATKVLKEYLSPLPEPDEAAVNAYAVALSQADDQAKKNAFFRESVQFYFATNAKLEATRPGMKRWGIEWLPADEATRKLTEWSNVQFKANADLNDIYRLRAQLANAQTEQTRLANSHSRRGPRPESMQPQIDRLQSEIQDKQRAYQEVLASGQAPPLPKEFAAVPVMNGPTAIASADNSSSPGEAALSTVAPPPQPPALVSPKPPVSDPPQSSAPATPDATPVSAPPVEPIDQAVSGGRKVHVTTYAAAFPVSTDLVVSAMAAVSDDARIELQMADGTPFEASIVRSDSDSGLVLLRVKDAHLNYLAVANNFAGGAISAVSFPTVNLFQPQAEAIGGSFNSHKPAETVRLNRSPRLGGGPLMADGKVVGVQLATRDSDPATIPAASLDALHKLLGEEVPSGHGSLTDAAGVTMQLVAVREK